MISILTYGTFDLFHYGHVCLLQRARALGDRLVVAVSTDEFNIGKGKKSVFPFEHRKGILRSIRWVDEVIDETSWEQKEADIRRLNIDLLVMGDDWRGKFDFLMPLCKVVYLPRTEGVSSTMVRHWIKAFPDNRIQELREALDLLATVVRTIGE